MYIQFLMMKLDKNIFHFKKSLKILLFIYKYFYFSKNHKTPIYILIYIDTIHINIQVL